MVITWRQPSGTTTSRKNISERWSSFGLDGRRTTHCSGRIDTKEGLARSGTNSKDNSEGEVEATAGTCVVGERCSPS